MVLAAYGFDGRLNQRLYVEIPVCRQHGSQSQLRLSGASRVHALFKAGVRGAADNGEAACGDARKLRAHEGALIRIEARRIVGERARLCRDLPPPRKKAPALTNALVLKLEQRDRLSDEEKR